MCVVIMTIMRRPKWRATATLMWPFPLFAPYCTYLNLTIATNYWLSLSCIANLWALKFQSLFAMTHDLPLLYISPLFLALPPPIKATIGVLLRRNVLSPWPLLHAYRSISSFDMPSTPIPVMLALRWFCVANRNSVLCQTLLASRHITCTSQSFPSQSCFDWFRAC